jgi:hypothetical protein
MSMSFTMNWKMMRAGRPVRFEVGEPLFQVVPLRSDPCADLEAAAVSYRKLDENAEVARSYREWDAARRGFVQRIARGTSGRRITSSGARCRVGRWLQGT